jgi:hypothetical protein
MRPVAILLAAVLLAPALRAAPTGDTAADVEFFEKKVRPILFERCQRCHSTQKKQKGGLLLDARTALLKGGDSGPAVVPGEPDRSLLI